MRIYAIAAALVALAMPAGLRADLPVGAPAPNFATQAALDGKVVAFNLRAALRRGPVVLYFYPAAFTTGCNLEARAFADAHDRFAAAGATVIGMSTDRIDTLRRFSTEECRSKFAVGVATPAITAAYDVELKPEHMPPGAAGKMPARLATKRTSYVISQDGRIRMVHSDLRYDDHVRLSLEAVQSLRRRR